MVVVVAGYPVFSFLFAIENLHTQISFINANSAYCSHQHIHVPKRKNAEKAKPSRKKGGETRGNEMKQ